MEESNKNPFSEAYYIQKSNLLRKNTTTLIYNARKGHIGGCFSCMDILVALYYSGVFQLSPDNRADHFILSKGHCATALYAVLQDCGHISEDELFSYGKNGTMLGGHPDYRLQGIDVTSGSLGMGLGIGAGIVYAKRKDGSDSATVVMTGDGECYEGSIWEAAMFASHHSLCKLIWVIDRNQLCCLDETEDCLKLEPLSDRIRAFGWEVQDVDGHSIEQLISSMKNARYTKSNKPQAIIANTIKGKGVSFMENQLIWHHKVPDEDEYKKIIAELS